MKTQKTEAIESQLMDMHRKKLQNMSVRLDRMIAVQSLDVKSALVWLKEWAKSIEFVGFKADYNPQLDLKRAGFHTNAFLHIVGGWENPEQYGKWVIGQILDYLEYGQEPHTKTIMMLDEAITRFSSNDIKKGR